MRNKQFEVIPENYCFSDRFCTIGYNEEKKCSFYADITCQNYIEFSLPVAKYIIDGMKENLKTGYKRIHNLFLLKNI